MSPDVADPPEAAGTLFGVPEGYDALVLAGRARAGGGRPVLHVARDDARMAALARHLAFFAPSLPLVALPAWDCQPYDRVSPNVVIAGRRVEALATLAGPWAGAPRIVLTTVNAVLQRLPPRRAFAGAALVLSAGGRCQLETLLGYFQHNGYGRAGTVREPGEFAVRGGIVDVFPPGRDQPLRLDLFGDDLESIRCFDAASQRTTGTLDEARLLPVGEAPLRAAAIARFRQAYRSRFGGDVADDPVYQAVTEGRRHPGMEHWLPLFHDRMETLFDYLRSAQVSLDHQAAQAAAARFDLIGDYFQARLELQQGRRARGAAPYRPLPPEALYLHPQEWSDLLQRVGAVRHAPFAGLDGEADAGAGIAAVSAGDAGGRPGLNFAEARVRSPTALHAAVGEAIAGEQAAGRRVLVAAHTEGSRDRLVAMLGEHGVEALAPADDWAGAQRLGAKLAAAICLPLEHGFRADGLTVIAEQDILGERLARPTRRRRRGDAFLREVSALNEGDFVVHVEHGIGRFEGLETLDVAGAPHDCLRLCYAGDDKLFVPVENIDVLSRYGSDDSQAVLDRLGGAAWQARKARAKQRIRDMAEQLIGVAAQRRLRRTGEVTPPAGTYDEFCARFVHAETDDQLRAIDDTLEDLAAGRPMDRLICGDVGFGKTEVALRAALVMAMEGYQVAVVTPTTLLCRQHYQLFGERFAGLPLRVRQLSRLVAGKDAAAVRQELASGDCNIVIGTHALLAKSIRFANLGLLVIDEEQHFGVAQKERLKALRAEVHVLTLTATPIPRTLQLALSGVREMSLIATPPVDRLAVRTFVLPYDGLITREAILRERYRGGQIFYVCPRIEHIPRVHDRLVRLVPEVSVETAHGRMAGAELERVMTRFYDGAFDVLLCTNIIESGLDIPNANTIIIHRADMFGLAQLYQLRGRVGRTRVRAYAYLTTHPDRPLTPTAKRRLEAIQTLDSLGAGFSLASHDMDIRGAGNLLGEEQSGHVREVGVELYQQLLEEAVHASREADGGAAPAVEAWVPQITLGTPVLIPDDYVADLSVRLSLYRRIAGLVDQEEIESLAAELTDRFGRLPAAVENLLKVIAIKRLCRVAGVDRLDAGPRGAVIGFRGNDFANPAGLVGFIARQGSAARLRPDHRLVLRRAWADADQRLRGLTGVMRDLADLAA